MTSPPASAAGVPDGARRADREPGRPLGRAAHRREHRAVGRVLRADPGAARPAGRGDRPVQQGADPRAGHRARCAHLGDLQPGRRRVLGPDDAAGRPAAALDRRRGARRRAGARVPVGRGQRLVDGRRLVRGAGLAQRDARGGDGDGARPGAGRRGAAGSAGSSRSRRPSAWSRGTGIAAATGSIAAGYLATAAFLLVLVVPFCFTRERRRAAAGAARAVRPAAGSCARSGSRRASTRTSPGPG